MIVVSCTTPDCDGQISSLHPIENFKCQRCSVDVPAFQSSAHDRLLGRNRRTPYQEMKQFMSGDMKSAGFHVTKIRREEREFPDWARTNAGVRSILLAAFPKIETNPFQRVKAGRWAQVIRLYFQMGWTDSEVAGELNEKVNTIKMIVRGIKYTSEGKTWNGSPRKR